MLTRRLLVAGPVLVLVLAAAYSLWLAFQVRSDLNDAQASADELRSAIDRRDSTAREQAVRDLQAAAERAHDRTAGAWWRLITHLPLVGDDASGVRALSSSLDVVARQGVGPLSQSLDRVKKVPADGGVDLKQLEALRSPVAEAHDAFVTAAREVAGLDSSGYAGSVRMRFDEYVRLVGSVRSALSSAETALDVLPSILGADGPQNYLLVFQNNAEIRSTGGMPGSWALLHTDGGQLSLTRQGTAADFPYTPKPVLPLSRAETKIFHSQLGTYWQDAGFTLDFPRSAALWNAHWSRRFPDTKLDGVVAVDPVALSYLLRGTGSVQVDGVQLTADNAVRELLNTPYVRLSPQAQNKFFADAAKAIFNRATHSPSSPIELISAFQRAAHERRLLIASFDPATTQRLARSQVVGTLAGDDGRTPHVDIGLDDATGSKMSYYLRYTPQVRARSCSGGRQELSASMTLRQSIAPSEAAKLPTSITGGGNYGTEPGSQLVVLHLYAPYGGTLSAVRLDGKAINAKPDELNGRPVFTAVVLLSTAEENVLSWSMTTGPGQTGATELQVTPGVQAGSDDAIVRSAC